jgi:NAD-dependent DNA ligase
MLGSTGGPKITRIGKLFMVKNKKEVRDHLLEIVEKHKKMGDIANSQILNDIILLQELTEEAILINPNSRNNPVRSEVERKDRVDEYQKLCDKINEVGQRLVKTNWYKQNKDESKSRKTHSVPQYTLKRNKGVGSETAKSVFNFFNSDEGKETIKKINKLGLSPAGVDEIGNNLEGKNFVLTGTLPNMTREEAKELIIKNGGKVSSKVSSKTDYVIVGEEPGSKFDNAKKLKIPIVSEEQLLNMIT